MCGDEIAEPRSIGLLDDEKLRIFTDDLVRGFNLRHWLPIPQSLHDVEIDSIAARSIWIVEHHVPVERIPIGLAMYGIGRARQEHVRRVHHDRKIATDESALEEYAPRVRTDRLTVGRAVGTQHRVA